LLRRVLVHEPHFRVHGDDVGRNLLGRDQLRLDELGLERLGRLLVASGDRPAEEGLEAGLVLLGDGDGSVVAHDSRILAWSWRKSNAPLRKRNRLAPAFCAASWAASSVPR